MTDPRRDRRGRFLGRRYLGELGSKRRPVWFVVGSYRRSATTGK